MVALDTYAPFDSGAGANVTEDTWRKFARHWLATGVIAGEANELECYGDSSGLQVKVKTGQAWIRGHWGEVTSEKTIPISANASGNPRIDRVVVRVDFTANTVSIEVVEGTPAGSPTAPSLTQSATRWEVPLAQVAVANGAATIAAGNVTDERGFTSGGVMRFRDATRRDLWITSPEEGMHAYLADSNTLVYYDGASWASAAIKPALVTAEVTTTETTTSTSFTDLATAGPAQTVTVGASGMALVVVSCQSDNSGAGASLMSYAVSGATTSAATDGRATNVVGGNDVKMSLVTLHTGLTPGSNTFTSKYRVTSGTGTFALRQIIVFPL